MSFLFAKFSTYYLSLERLLILSAAFLALAFLSFGMIDSFAIKAVLFVIYSVAIFNVGPIINRIFGKLTLTASDKAIIEEIRCSGLPLDKQNKIYRERIPKRSWQTPAMIAIVWTFILKLFIIFGGAGYITQFQAIQGIIEFIPSDIFLKNGVQRGAYDISLLKIFKVVDAFSLPFVILAICVLTIPFLKNPKIFPISPMAIYSNKKLNTLQMAVRFLWAFIVFLVLLFLFAGICYTTIANGYTGKDSFGKDEFGRTLSVYIWYKTCGFSIVFGIFTSALLKMIIDTFSLVIILFWKTPDA